MAALTAGRDIERVLEELATHPDWLWPHDPRAHIPDGFAEKLYSLSRDVSTTVWLLLLWQEESVADDFVENIDIAGVVAHYREHARTESAAKQRLADEVDALVERAGAYGEHTFKMMDDGLIKGNGHVRDFCKDKLESLLHAWIRYRVKLQAVLGDW